MSECEKIPDKSWYKEKFEEEIKDQLDIEELAAKEIVSNIELMTTQTEIFDLGTTTHITSYWNNFFAFQSITPKVLRAINKQGFSTVKREKLVLYLLNSITFSKLYLSEVLYCSEAGYTLVSIWQLDNASFSTTFANGRCML